MANLTTPIAIEGSMIALIGLQLVLYDSYLNLSQLNIFYRVVEDMVDIQGQDYGQGQEIFQILYMQIRQHCQCYLQLYCIFQIRKVLYYYLGLYLGLWLTHILKLGGAFFNYILIVQINFYKILDIGFHQSYLYHSIKKLLMLHLIDIMPKDSLHLI